MSPPPGPTPLDTGEPRERNAWRTLCTPRAIGWSQRVLRPRTASMHRARIAIPEPDHLGDTRRMPVTADMLSRESLQQPPRRRAPAPAFGFSEHHAAITQILVLDATQVISVDQDGHALRWDPRAATVVARYSLPKSAVVSSVFALRNGGLAYVAIESQALRKSVV